MVGRKQDSPFYWYDFRIAGKRYRGSTKQTSPAKARTFESSLMGQLQQGSAIPEKSPTLSLFSPRFLRFIEESRLEPKTKAYYRDGWRLLKSTAAAGMRMDHITTSTAATLTFPGGGSNANCAYRTLRRMLTLAAEWNCLTRVPTIHLAKERHRERMIGPAEEAAILAKASPRLRAVVTLIMDTGMRPSEAASLAWNDVDFQSGVILIVAGKTNNARRHLPMTGRVRETLTALLPSESPWVFPAKRGKGKRTTGPALTAAFCQLKRRIGLPTDLVLYSARHTFATDFLGSTGNVAKLKKVMGHASLTTTARYLHPDTADLGMVMDQRNLQRTETVWSGRVQ